MADNALKILRLIRQDPGISRAEIARKTRLSNPSVSAIVDRLIAEGLVREAGKGVSGGGKRPILLEINPHALVTIGLDIGSAHLIRGVLCDGSGRMIDQAEAAFEQNRFEEIIETAVALIHTLQQAASAPVKGIGIAIAGIVAPGTNEITFSAHFDLSHKQMADAICEQTGIPVMLENRARLAATAESVSGAAAGCEDFIYISTGKSIGSALYCGGRLFTGSGGASGEIRNLPVLWTANGKLTAAPLEAAAGEETLIDEVSAALGRKIRFGDLLAEVQQGNPECIALVKQNAGLIAQAAATLCSIMDAPLILLGGRMRDFGKTYFEEINRRLQEQLAGSDRDAVVEPSHYGSIGSSLGAALMMTDCLIDALGKTNHTPQPAPLVAAEPAND